MKINWGTGIAIFYLCFMAAMIFMVIKSSQNNVHLVQENYYQRDLDYEEFRSKRENSTVLETPVSIQYSAANNTVEIIFPQHLKAISGKLTLFRPSNKYLDKTIELNLNENASMSVPVDEDMPRGKWRVQVDWEAQGMKFYKEETIVI